MENNIKSPYLKDLGKISIADRKGEAASNLSDSEKANILESIRKVVDKETRGAVFVVRQIGGDMENMEAVAALYGNNFNTLKLVTTLIESSGLDPRQIALLLLLDKKV